MPQTRLGEFRPYSFSDFGEEEQHPDHLPAMTDDMDHGMVHGGYGMRFMQGLSLLL